MFLESSKLFFKKHQNDSSFVCRKEKGKGSEHFLSVLSEREITESATQEPSVIPQISAPFSLTESPILSY